MRSIWNQVCVVDGFSSELYQQRISRLHVVIKKISDNIPEKSELQKFILPVKISWLNFLCGFRGRNEKFAEIRAGLPSRLATLHSIYSILHSHVPNARLCSNVSPLAGYH